MTSDAARILSDAMHLSESDRAELAAHLIDSIEQSIDEQVESSWDAEVARRVVELDNGAVKPIPWPVARRLIMGESDDNLAFNS